MNKIIKNISIISITILVFLLLYIIINDNTIGYNNPIIPKGFSKVETENASWELCVDGTIKGWNNGLVIEDKNGNQFVWVPVDNINVNYKNNLVESKGKNDLIFLTHLPNGIKDELNQIKKYGGFYIGRYEVGLPEDLIEQKNAETISVVETNVIHSPIIKRNSIVWNNISVSNAIKSAETLYNTKNVKSGLVTLSQWYTLMNWLENSGYNTTIDSKEWGNYSNSMFPFTGWYSTDSGNTYIYANNKLKSEHNMLLSTGSSDRNMANNIYDLAGNIYEYTSTYTSWANTYAYVGGYYDNSGIDCANKDSLYFNANHKIGYRIALFLG